ncbi:Core-2/I-Branching enzyme [Trichostrongylus colubriformis]|uniref:Core-2/I-Branching enzyme n=1 Tax=Trichostrongylus colubriformis TaxID=6319 RepID=A0AAN8F3T5_TRICO
MTPSIPTSKRHRLLNIIVVVFVAGAVMLSYYSLLAPPLSVRRESWNVTKCELPTECEEASVMSVTQNYSTHFRRRLETKHVDCGRVLRSDEEYIRTITARRPKLRPSQRRLNCNYIRRSVIGQKNYTPLPFGVAYARIVYESYDFIEDELTASYHPQNVFCYSVDKKAPDSFNLRIKFLSRCFSNVLVTQARFPVNSAGRYQNHAHHECLKLLINVPGWEYVILMQNYDVIIRSVYETISIFQALNGSNDISVVGCDPRRLDHSAAWDIRSLKLLPNEYNASAVQNKTLRFKCGSVQASLSHSAVSWMVRTANLTTLLDQLNTDRYGVDEILLATLKVNAELGMPGKFASSCSKRNQPGKETPYFTRKNFRFTRWQSRDSCPTKRFRHSICIFGIEDLPILSQRHELLANKILPYFDYAVVDCLHELIFNRTHLGQSDHELDWKRYWRKC